MTIYTLGYRSWKIEDVEAVLQRLDAILVDVRFVPRSRIPTWNSGVLSRRLGEVSARGRYVWLREFGNRNYKGTVDQIEIADFPAGEQKLKAIAAIGRAIILLCGCTDLNQCHRKLLAGRLARSWGAGVVHLTRPDDQISIVQPTLF